MFRTEFDESQRLLITENQGYWTLDTMAAFRSDVADHIRRIKATHIGFGILIRAAGMSVQAPEIADAFTRFSKELIILCPGPIAIVAGSVLNKLQVLRSASHERVRVFLDEEQAKSWLLATLPPSATSR